MFGIGAKGIYDSAVAAYFAQNWIYYLLALIGCFPVIPKLEVKWKDNAAWQAAYGIGVIAALLLSLSYIINQAYNPFIYFNF